MAEAEVESKSKPWQWPGEWMRDEKFWRDVASRTLAGALVVFIGYLVAVANGLLAVPSVAQVVVGIAFIAASVGIFSLFVAKYRTWINPLVNKAPKPWDDVADTLLKLIVLGLCIGLLISGISSFRP